MPLTRDLRCGSTESARYVHRVARQLAAKFDEKAPDGSGFQPLEIDARCPSVRSVHEDWHWNAFMYGPLATALLVPLPVPPASPLASQQRRALELLAERVSSGEISQYYSGAWLTLATLTLNGDLAAACPKLFVAGCPPRARWLKPNSLDGTMPMPPQPARSTSRSSR